MGRKFMFDCGPGTTYKMSKKGWHALDVDVLCFSHHHFDHTAGYPAFLLTRWDHSTGNETPLRVFGPAGTEQLTERLIGDEGAFSTDWNARVNHPLSHRMHKERGGSLPRLRPSFDARDVEPGIVYDSAGFRITAAATEHVQPYLDSLAYRLDTPDGSIVFTGDAQPCDLIVALARGADALVSLCGNFQSSLEERGIEKGQTGTLGAAEMAAEAGVSQLFLVHVGPALSNPEAEDRALTEIAAIYSGKTTLTDEMTSYDILPGETTRAQRSPATHPHIHRH
jgi:ribonuclease BN (tRNA processing enzyme)